MTCVCNVSPAALGLTDCYFNISQIKKIIFTTSNQPTRFQSPSPSGLNSGVVVFSADNNSNVYAIEDSTYTVPATVFTHVDNVYYYENSYALQTEIADEIISEREDDVRQAVGGNQFFVRRGKRKLTAKFVTRAAELVHLFEKLRCQKNLFAFLVDAAGVTWGKRQSRNKFQNDVAPIRVMSNTISSRMVFAGTDSVSMVETSFDFEDFSDGDLVPVSSDDFLAKIDFRPTLNYRNLIGLAGNYEIDASGNLLVRIFYEIHLNSIQNVQPLEGLITAGAGPVLVDSTNTVLATATAEVAPGLYQFVAPLPATWRKIRLLANANVWHTTSTGLHLFDLYNFEITR